VYSKCKGKKKKKLDDELSDIEENNQIVNENNIDNKSESGSISEDYNSNDDEDYGDDEYDEYDDEEELDKNDGIDNKTKKEIVKNIIKEDTFINPLSKVKGIKQEIKQNQEKKVVNKEEEEEKNEKFQGGAQLSRHRDTAHISKDTMATQQLKDKPVSKKIFDQVEIEIVESDENTDKSSESDYDLED
jgi:hypothetical protein